MLLRFAVTAVLCCNEASSHEQLDEEYQLGDSSGCTGTFVQVNDVMECLAAKDRVGTITAADHLYQADYLSNQVKPNALPQSMSAFALTGCGYVEADALSAAAAEVNSVPGTFVTEAKTFFNPDDTATRIASTVEWTKPPRPYCKKTNSKLHHNQVLFHGDVNIDRWSTTSKDFPGSYNIGFSATCKSLQWRLENIFEAFEPAVVVTACGEKDLDEGVSVRKTYRRFAKFADVARKHHASLIYLGTKPFPWRRMDYRRTYIKYDESIKRLVRRRAGKDDHGYYGRTFAMVDVHNNFVRAGNPRDLYEFDGSRLSATGYGFWSSWTRKALDDTTCLIWGRGLCKKRRKMSPVRRATANSPGVLV